METPGQKTKHYQLLTIFKMKAIQANFYKDIVVIGLIALILYSPAISDWWIVLAVIILGGRYEERPKVKGK